MKLFYKMVTAILLVVFCMISSASVFAYTELGYGYISKSIPIEDRTTYSEFRYHSIDAWNNCGAGVNIYTVPGSGNSWLIDEQVADTWFGQYEAVNRQYVFWGKATKFKITLNRTTLVSQSSNLIKSVIVHELGHALNLADNPPQSPSIMRYDRDRETMITPQQDDIDGVIAMY